MARTLGWTALALAAGALLLYAAALAWLWSRQESLLFFPEPLPATRRLSTEPDVHELTVPVAGASLSVLQLRLPDPKGVVFFLHGNAGNLAGWFTNTALYREANYDLVMLDYRGYGKSSGRIESEAQLHEDTLAVWNAVARRYAGRKLVVHGRSLGTAVAAALAVRLAGQGRAPDLTVLVSPYSSMQALVDEFYPWVPRFVLRYPLETQRHLLQGPGPVLLLHGERDQLIRPAHSERLAQLQPRARLQVIAGAGHNDIHEFPAYRQALLHALAAL